MRLILGLTFVVASFTVFQANAEQAVGTCEMSLNAYGCNKPLPKGNVTHTADNPAGMWGRPVNGKSNDEAKLTDAEKLKRREDRKKAKSNLAKYISDNSKKGVGFQPPNSPDKQRAFDEVKRRPASEDGPVADHRPDNKGDSEPHFPIQNPDGNGIK